MKTAKRTLIGILALGLVAWWLSPGKSRQNNPSAAPTGGRTLLWARGKDSIKLDPADITDGESAKVTAQIFDTLVQYKDGSTDVEAALATSWDTSPDGLTWTFHLREGVVFHDGTPCDAEAVVFSFRRQMDPAHPAHTGDFIYWHDMFSGVDRIEAADASTVRFVLKTPYAPFLSNLAMFSAGIVSPAAFARHGKNFAQHPVGTGPFVFSAWERDAKIVLAANDRYWGSRPAIDRLVIQVVPDNTARYLLLADGKIHLADGLSPQHVAKVKADPKLVLHEIPGMNVAYLALNNAKPPFADARARRAVAHALDLAGIAQTLYLGTAAPAATPLPPTLWGANDALRPRAHNPAEAQRLLAEAGVAPGMRVELAAFSNPRPYMPEPAKLATTIRAALKDVGLDCAVTLRDWAEHLAHVQQGEHQMCLLGWSGDNGDPDNFLYVLLDKENTRPPASNVSFYQGEALHERLLAARRENAFEERTRLYRESQEIIHADCPMIPLVHTTQMMASTRALSNFALHPVGLVRLTRVRFNGPL